jgi:hypothetical protein
MFKTGDSMILDGCQVVVTARRVIAGGAVLDVKVIGRRNAEHNLTGWTTSESYALKHGDRL